MNFVATKESADQWSITSIGSPDSPIIGFNIGTNDLKDSHVQDAVESLHKKVFGAIIITKNCEFNYGGAPLHYYPKQRVEALRANEV